jgi:beta-glucosidase
MRRLLLSFIIIGTMACGNTLHAQQKLPYRNASLSIEARTRDLLGRMTLEEKVGQLLCPLGWQSIERKGKDVACTDYFKQLVEKNHVGMLWAVFRADPWTRRTLANGLDPELAAKAGNALQKYVIEHTRLGIPLFIAEEAPHGHMAIGATVFPTGIGMASTWSADLLKETGQTIAEEVRTGGGQISYGPVLDLVREPRWSRVEETFGEDPVLSGTLVRSYIEGAGGGHLSQPDASLVTLKHFLAYGIPQGGQNGNPSVVGRRDLLQNFLPPFRQALEAGALSVMTSYNSVDGVPCTANSYLLTDLLHKEIHFRGFTVSDLYSIEGIHQSHQVAPTIRDAATMAMKAGLDADLGGAAFTTLIDAVNNHEIEAAAIDTATCRILRLKFEMGLFEHPYVNVKTAKEKIGSAAHTDLARRVAQASMTLLKNDHQTLPLQKSVSRVAVIGPNADNVYNMLGDYTAPQAEGRVRTVLNGITDKIGAAHVEYVKGCAIRDTNDVQIDEAVAAARRADVAIVVVGGSSARDFKTDYKETGAAVVSEKSVSDMECGEGYDRASLALLGKQMELLKAIKATGKPLVVVYIEGRPLDMNWAQANADALLLAWYPGQEGGDAIADVLFGDVNPAGRLPISVPRSVGQLPVNYNKPRPIGHDYVEMPVTPLYAFGYGLSYTTFAYDNAQIAPRQDGTFDISFSVRNTGNCDGEEVAQLYLHADYSPVVQPEEQLKHFARIFLQKGESKIVTFRLTREDLSVIDASYRPSIAKGSYEIRIGAASNDIRLRSTLNIQ